MGLIHQKYHHLDRPQPQSINKIKDQYILNYYHKTTTTRANQLQAHACMYALFKLKSTADSLLLASILAILPQYQPCGPCPQAQVKKDHLHDRLLIEQYN